jgi:hypothetical protein
MGTRQLAQTAEDLPFGYFTCRATSNRVLVLLRAIPPGGYNEKPMPG